MNKIIYLSAILLAVTFLASLSVADSGTDSLYPYSESILPYLNKTMEGRCFWFSVSSDEKTWGVDWNKERLPFTKIIIHHTGGSTDQSLGEIEAINKERYIARYNSSDNDPYVKGLEPHSGHMVNGKETFMPYHYMIYENGTVLEWLNPLIKEEGAWYVDNVAWHAGNWTTNCESLSVCLIGNYTANYPTEKQLQSLKNVIADLKGYNPKADVLPHKALIVPGSKYGEWLKEL
ncbi:MAG: peptidoglycan recognition family protein [Candidatus Pacebacteria bacterium]|nr:peptidoglycan recognition family protein [Candidatus Paceibacterota bacterium]